MNIAADLSLPARFWEKVVIAGPDECWEWTASRLAAGYGQICVGGRDGRPIGAHRVSWVLHFGLIPDELHVLHHCDNPPCINPAHLFLGTNTDNIADRVAKGRSANGQTHRTHCKNGHPFSGRWASGERYCVICHRAKRRLYVARRRERRQEAA